MKYVFVMFLAMKLKLIPGYNMYLWEYRIHALFYTKTIMFKQYITDDFSQIQLHSLNKYTLKTIKESFLVVFYCNA